MERESTIIVESLSVERPVLLTSFPGIGLVGTIVTGHFIMELNLETIGVIESRLLPPVATLFDGIILPPIRVYQSAEHNFVLIHSDVPILPQIAYDVSQTIVEWAASINASLLVSIAGVTTFEDRKRVFGAATSRDLLDRIEKVVEIFKTGTISGIAGSILNECVARKFPGIALLGETMGFNPDPRAAAEVIKKMNDIFEWNIAVDKLIQEAEFIEAQMQKLAEQTRIHEERGRREELPMFG
jgi:uncharacterized protein